MKIFLKNIPFLAALLKNKDLTQLIKYGIVGGICTILDFSLLYLLTNFLKINYLEASIVSFIAGTILNYFLCTNWIFDIRVVKKQYQEFIYYLLITGVGLVINTLIIWVFTEYAGLYFMLSKIIAVFITFWWNFCARKFFLHS